MTVLRCGLALVAVLCGLLLPQFYDWSGEDQSYSSPVVRWLALGILLISTCAIGWLLISHWMRVRPEPIADRDRRQFGIRHLLIATTLGAFAISAPTIFKFPLFDALVLIALAVALGLAYQQPAWRWQVALLLICLWGPFLWLITWYDDVRILLMLPGVPTLVPTAVTGWALGRGILDNTVPWSLYTLVELLFGLWTIRLGVKPATACAMAVLVVAIGSSFGLHALVRM